MKHPTIKFLALSGSLLASSLTLQAQEAKPVAPKPPAKAESIQIVYEAFSLPMSEAATLLRSAPTDAGFYKKMVDGVRGQKITQEVFLMGRGISGQRVTVEHITQMIYNTEVEPPELPNQVAGGAGHELKVDGTVKPANFPITPATPTSFDTRNVGDMLEVEIQENPNEATVALQLNISKVGFIRRDTWGQGPAATEMPRFAVQQIQSGLNVQLGSPSFLGTINPPEELQPEKAEDRIWFAFITAKAINQ